MGNITSNFAKQVNSENGHKDITTLSGGASAPILSKDHNIDSLDFVVTHYILTMNFESLQAVTDQHSAAQPGFQFSLKPRLMH